MTYTAGKKKENNSTNTGKKGYNSSNTHTSTWQEHSQDRFPCLPGNTEITKEVKIHKKTF